MEKWKFAQLIINWQHQYGRNNLPWQIKNTPYNTWISEIMLQQTQVKTVIPYFNKFISQFNNFKQLSEAKLDEILYLWSGLGYYNRAKNLHKTAKIIIKEYKGKFPQNIFDVIKLPGIGKTTACAILSLSYNLSFSILDANVKRILIRFYNIKDKKKILENKLWKIIQLITPIHNSNKFNQGMMDLGALICTHNTPKCKICPILNSCKYKPKNKNQIKSTIKNLKKKKILYFSIIITFKKYILLKKEKKNFWKNLFYFPIFNNIKNMDLWLIKKNIHEKYNFIYSMVYNISNIILNIIFFKIKLKNFFLLKLKNNKNKIWFNLIQPQYIGIPSPIKKIIQIYKNNILKKKDKKMKKVFCKFLGKIEEGYKNQFYPGKIGKKIHQNISKIAWKKWMTEQTKLINEKKLNTTKIQDYQKIEKEMIKFLFNKK